MLHIGTTCSQLGHFIILLALGNIGLLTEDLLKNLLWIVRFEKLPALRAEGCLALATLGVREASVEETLRDILSVDDDPLVLRWERSLWEFAKGLICFVPAVKLEEPYCHWATAVR